LFNALDPRSPVPLYEQIAARIRVAVAAEEFDAGQPLPSVRQLSASLRVNPATVIQAYRDLEREGFVEMRHGAGTFVRELPPERRRSEQTRQARQLVRELLAAAARQGIGAQDVRSALEEELGGRAHA
jgi:GntR family transcriptional regulator